MERRSFLSLVAGCVTCPWIAHAVSRPPIALRRLRLVNAHTGETFDGAYRDDKGPIEGVLDERGLDRLLIFDGRQLRLEGRSQALLGGPWRPLPGAQRLTLQHRLARVEFLARSGGFRLN